MKDTYYKSEVEKNMALKKLCTMTKDTATELYELSKDKFPVQSLVVVHDRNKPYSEVRMKTLEYLWFGSKKASVKIRLYAKAAYLLRLDDETNPRKHLLFSLDEVKELAKAEEKQMMMEAYQFEYDDNTSEEW